MHKHPQFSKPNMHKHARNTKPDMDKAKLDMHKMHNIFQSITLTNLGIITNKLATDLWDGLTTYKVINCDNKCFFRLLITYLETVNPLDCQIQHKQFGGGPCVLIEQQSNLISKPDMHKLLMKCAILLMKCAIFGINCWWNVLYCWWNVLYCWWNVLYCWWNVLYWASCQIS